MNQASAALRTTAIRPLFLSYLIPSMLGMILMALNILVDGIFVSNGIGQEALAAVNIAVPIFSILLSISLWIGMGGATLFSIQLGKGNMGRARSIFTQSISLALLVCTLLIALSLWKIKEMAYWFGASDEIYANVHDYLFIILIFGVFYVLENILSIFIRNDGNPRLAMVGLVITSVSNIILNYLFIFTLKSGIEGAAYATGLSTMIGFLILLTHFMRPSSVLQVTRLKFERKTVLDMLKIGIPSFIVEISAAFTVIAYNTTFMHFVGQVGVMSYAILNNIHVVLLMLFLGIGAALQPIVSFHHGAKLHARMRQFVKLAVRTGIIVGCSILVLGWVFGDQLIALFGDVSGDVYTFTREGIPLFFIGYLFLGFNLVYAEYYQSIKRTGLSVAIILSRSIILFIPLLWFIPTFIHPNLIWLAFPLAEGLTMAGLIVAQKGLPRIFAISP